MSLIEIVGLVPFKRGGNNMALCEESKCIRRYYQFLTVDGKLQTKLKKWYVPGDEEKTGADAGGMSEARRTAATEAAEKALKELEKNGLEIQKCPDKCRCPHSERPRNGAPEWSGVNDEQEYETNFVFDGVKLTIVYTIEEQTADIEQRCKPKRRTLLLTWVTPNGNDIVLM
jgi:hypothetical protein